MGWTSQVSFQELCTLLEKIVKEELKLEVERATEKSKSGPEMMARKDYIPFNRYNFTKSHIYINSGKLYL